jgi:hypothetical protein
MTHYRRCCSIAALAMLLIMTGSHASEAQSILHLALRASLNDGALAGRTFEVSFTYNADDVSAQGDSFIGLKSFDFVLEGVPFSRSLIAQGGQVIFRDGVLNNVTASFQGQMPDGSPVNNITFGFGGPGVIGYIDLNGTYGQGSFVFALVTPPSGVQVTSGYLDMSGPAGALVLAGTGGFVLDAAVRAADGVYGPSACSSSPRACAAGSMLDLSALWVGGDVRGTAAVAADVYRNLGSAASLNQVAVSFQGGALLPPRAAVPVTIHAPFAFSGTFDHADATAVPTEVTLTGNGTASLTLIPNPLTSDTWSVSKAVYAFGPAMPAGWVTADLGATGLRGDTSAVGDRLLVTGAGTDIWGRADAFRYVFRTAPAEGEIVTRVDAQLAGHPFAKAGVMIRTGIEPGSAHAILNIKPGGGLEFMSRPVTDGDTAFIAGAQATYPVSLRLQRAGNRITASYSADGLLWTVLGTTDIEGARFVGVAVTSHDPFVLNDAAFSATRVTDTVQPLPRGWSSTDLGEPGVAGTSAFADGVFQLSGAGADIWRAADAFHFVRQEWAGDLSLVARVVRLENTDTFAKAGIMIRAGAESDAAHVIVDVRPNGEIEFMTRDKRGANTTYLGGTASSFPTWVMLRRTGEVVIGYTSRDGVCWTALGSVRPDLPATVLAGLAVTSHDDTRAAAAIIDNVSLEP